MQMFVHEATQQIDLSSELFIRIQSEFHCSSINKRQLN